MHNLDPPYAHNDVKPGNILITRRKGQSPLAILMDFGSARPARKQIRSRSDALQLQVTVGFFLPLLLSDVLFAPKVIMFGSNTYLAVCACVFIHE